MKKVIFTLIAALGINLVQAQVRAVTEIGEEVILYQDGTWEYLNSEELLEKEIPLNKNNFKKDDESTFLLKSKRLNIGVYVNPKKWTFTKGTDNPDAEYEFSLKEEDLYGALITERVEIPIESFRIMALENARTMVPDIKIVKEEYRMVNGLKVLFLQMNGTFQGIKFSFYGYYFSNSKGSMQLITYTSQNLIEAYKSESEKLLNGLIEI